MRMTAISILLTVWLASLCAIAQPESQSTVQTTVCDLVDHPLQFKGKLIRVRVQIWSDYSRFWLNESAAGSKEIGKVCRWLPAEFTHPTNLIGSSAFGTFTGRLVYEPGSAKKRVRVRFIIENESDIYSQRIQNGLIVAPQRYDRSRNKLARPE